MPASDDTLSPGNDRTPAATPSPDVVFRRVGEETVLVNLRTSDIYGLNETATRAWELLSEGASREEMIGTMAGEFEVSTAVLAEEVDALLARLSAAGLLDG